jgi:hypothetical protein
MLYVDGEFTIVWADHMVLFFFGEFADFVAFKSCESGYKWGNEGDLLRKRLGGRLMKVCWITMKNEESF